MPTSLRVVLGLVGVFFGHNGVQWILDPSTAAEGLGMALPDGLARSTVVGDLGAFFLSAAAFVLLGALTARAHWLYAAAILFGLAATMRTVAWAMHQADFAAAFIAVEVVVTAFLLFAASRAR